MGLAKLVGQIGGAVTKTAENTWNNRKKISRGVGNTLGQMKNDLAKGYREARNGKTDEGKAGTEGSGE